MVKIIKKWYGKNNISIAIEKETGRNLAHVQIYKSKHRTNTEIPGSYTDLSPKDLAVAMNLYHKNKLEIEHIRNNIISGKYDFYLK